MIKTLKFTRKKIKNKKIKASVSFGELELT